MHLTHFKQLTIALLTTLVHAVPPEDFGFPSAPNDTVLAVSFSQRNGTYTGVQPGILFGSQVANVTEPVVALNLTAYQSLRVNASYITMMVDPDASYPENPTSRFILHYLQTNMMLMPAYPPQYGDSNLLRTIEGCTRLINGTGPLVPFMGPKPPTNSSAHRYILYAFLQPQNFTLPASFGGLSASNRTRFNLTSFIAQANLGTPAAANYFYASTMPDVPEFFVAAPGSSYPGGNGAAVTSGDPGRTATAAGPSSTGNAAAKMTAANVLGVGLLGLAALL